MKEKQAKQLTVYDLATETSPSKEQIDNYKFKSWLDVCKEELESNRYRDLVAGREEVLALERGEDLKQRFATIF